MRTLVTAFVVLIVLISCGSKDEQIPDYVWEEDRFVEVLTEFQKAESIVRLGYHKYPDSIYSNDSIYAAVFEKMGVVEEEFDSNYRYYLKDPGHMEQIYDQVIIRLSEQEAEIQKKSN